jgi:hypothetical protein
LNVLKQASPKGYESLVADDGHSVTGPPFCAFPTTPQVQESPVQNANICPGANGGSADPAKPADRSWCISNLGAHPKPALVLLRRQSCSSCKLFLSLSLKCFGQ